MKVSSNWIKKWLRRTMLTDASIIQALERAGIEVEQVVSSKQIDERVIVGLVKKVVQHPGADRLKLVDVSVGELKYKVVCGANNVREGLKVAFAQIGTILPAGDIIQKVTLRGETSEGMLCSDYELGIGSDHNGLLELPEDAVPGTLLNEIYPPDSVIDIKTPANRWDVQSVYGLAREVAAMTGETLVPLSPPPVKISAQDGVLAEPLEAVRYSLARIRVHQAAPSPSTLVAQLRSAGVRSIGPIVDVTNYVLQEVGQPLHAFDAAKVSLPISVRRATKGEVLVTLDGVKRHLHEVDLIIADARGPIALAGIMGGKSTEVTANTTEILLESAVFDGAVVRKTAQRHGLRTEASSRYERGLPSELTSLGLARALELLQKTADAELVKAYDTGYNMKKPYDIALPLSVAKNILGFRILHKEAVTALAKLGIEARDGNSNMITVAAVPWWRSDLKEPQDLIEEIVRVIGYDKVPSTIPLWRPRKIQFDRVRSIRRRIRDVLWAAGAFEVMTYSFVSAEQLEALGLNRNSHLKLKNPLSSEQAYLRSNLLPSHLSTLGRNRMYAKGMRFYEISQVFLKQADGDQPDEPLRLGVTLLEPAGAYSSLKGIWDAIIADLNVDVAICSAVSPPYAPGRVGELRLGDVQIGIIGQLHPNTLASIKVEGEVAYLEVDLSPIIKAAGVQTYRGMDMFPATYRDVTVVLPALTTWTQVRAVTAQWDVTFVTDYYSRDLPEGMKSLTIRLKLVLPDRTPTEAEAAELEVAVMAQLSSKFGAKLRS